MTCAPASEVQCGVCRLARVLWRLWLCSHDILDAISHLAGCHEAQQEELGLLAQCPQRYCLCHHHVPCRHWLHLLNHPGCKNVQVLPVKRRECS